MAPRHKMDNTAFEVDAEKGGVELTHVKMNETGNSNLPNSQSHYCQPDLCRSMHAKYLQQRNKVAASPWDRLKTVFLVSIIVLLTLWVLGYVASSRFGWV